MKGFRKKTDYGYYGSYGSRKRGVKRGRVALVVAVVAVIVVGVIIFFNLTRIQLMIKGYSWSQTSSILTLSKQEEQLLLDYSKIDDVDQWIELSENPLNLDEYDKYSKMHADVEKEVVVTYIDTVYKTQVPFLEGLGYSSDDIWEMVSMFDEESLQFIIDNNLSATETKPYREITGYNLKNMLAYMEQYEESKDYTYSVVYTNYPFIISTNEPVVEYQITDPDDITNLVKVGFYLPNDYEPSDLVTPNVPIAPDATDSLVREEAATALEKMVEEAKKDDMYLVLNSAYRSYQRQVETYNEFEEAYGGQYAAQYVAQPGASEHQTGLGIDLTSQSVLDGERLVFGDTDEYDWVLENAHKYGYIVRFHDETADITGIAHEPWHLRYIGVDLATAVQESGLTYEEYCLIHNIIPEVEVR